MFCRNCGKQLPDHAAFCSGCGTPCKRPDPAPVIEPQEPVAPEAEVELPVIQQEPAQDAVLQEMPAEQPVEEVAEVSAEQPQEEIVEAHAEQLQEAVTEEPAEQPREEAVEAPVEQPQEEIQEAPAAPVQEAVQLPVAQPAPVAVPQKVKKPRKQKKRPPFAVRMLMKILSFILCLVLFASLLVTVAVADLRQMISADGIKRVLDAFLSDSMPSAEYVVPPTAPQNQAGYGVVNMADVDIDIDDIPDDILGGGNGEENVNALVDWLYEELTKSADSEVKFTKNEFHSFVAESTVTDYISEKLAGYADDFINGTEETNITTEEIMVLLEENERELKSHLNVELTEEKKQDIQKQVNKMVEEEDINTTIREKVNTAVEGALQESLGMELETVRRILQIITSDLVFVICITLCVVLMGLLCLVNFYNVGAGLTWGAMTTLLTGVLVAAPLLALQFASDWILGLVPDLGKGIDLVNSFTSALAPIHYGVLIAGAALLVLSIVWRIVAKCLRSRESAVGAA